MNRKVLVSDYDQTFYLSNEDIEKNIQELKRFQDQGNIFVIATGRSYYDLKSRKEQYGFQYDYAILNHGATIIDKDNNILYNFTIKNETVSKLKPNLKLDKAVLYFCCSKLESRLNFNNSDLTKIYIEYLDEVNISEINNYINTKYNDVISYAIGRHVLKIVAKEVDKSKAIKILLNQINLNKSYTYTIGDGYNDISMIKDFNGYAISNAKKELKEVAIKEYDSVSSLIKDIMLDL